jgi:hypothetical protein
MKGEHHDRGLDKTDRKVGTVRIGQTGVSVRGKRRSPPIEHRWDELTG